MKSFTLKMAFAAILFLVNNTSVFAQDLESETQDSVLLIVEEMPEFSGGMDGLVNYLVKNVNYPKKDRKKGREGTVYVEFVIDKDGSITRVRVSSLDKKDATQAMKVEAIRVISEMPNWKPGKQRGEFVMVRYTIPIKYALK